MGKILTIAKWLIPVSGLLVVALGVTLLFVGLDELENLAVFIGLAMVLSGVSEIVAFKRKGKGRRAKSMLISGLLAVVLGAYTAFGRGLVAVVIILPVIFAVWIITASIPRIKEAFAERANGSPWWIFMLSFGLLGVALGVLLLFHPVLSGFVVTYSLAFMFIIHGTNAIVMFLPIKRKRAEDDAEKNEE